MALPPTAVAALLALAAAFVSLAGVSARDTDYCYSLDSDPYLHFSSKTAYEFVRLRDKDYLPHCSPVQIWWLNRHGTRFPGRPTIQKMQSLPGIRDVIISNHNEGTGRLCDEDLDRLRDWRLRVDPSQENLLTKAGEEELFLTARRLRERFPAVLQQPYSASRYKFRHTDSQRTEMSARKFAEGLFNSSDAVHIPPAEKQDMLLQPYASCKAWLDADKSDPPESHRFVEGTLMNALVSNVSSRLGYRAALAYDVVNNMYDMCRFEKAWEVGKTSPWCAAFSKEELKVLEYAEDLRYYYKSGYGDDMNVKLGCPLVKDLYEHFSAVEQGRGDQPAGIFYFAHSSILHMLQARLGVYDDNVPLKADNYAQQRNRKWQVSKMGPFAGNLGAIFLKCSPPGDAETKHVYFVGSEGPLDVPGCKVGLCTWEHFRMMLQPLTEQCSLDWCAGKGGAATRLPSWPALSLGLALAVAYVPSRRAV